MTCQEGRAAREAEQEQTGPLGRIRDALALDQPEQERERWVGLEQRKMTGEDPGAEVPGQGERGAGDRRPEGLEADPAAVEEREEAGQRCGQSDADRVGDRRVEHEQHETVGNPGEALQIRRERRAQELARGPAGHALSVGERVARVHQPALVDRSVVHAPEDGRAGEDGPGQID